MLIRGSEVSIVLLMVDLGPHSINFAEYFNVANVGMSSYKLYRRLELPSESISLERDKDLWLITPAEFATFGQH